MFVSPGWGDRLRAERKRLGLLQKDLAHQNTQRSYENEDTAPNLRYLADLEGRGFDVAYIVCGRLSERAIGEPHHVLIERIPDLSTEICVAVLGLVEAIVGSGAQPQPPKMEEPRSTLHNSRISFRGEGE